MPRRASREPSPRIAFPGSLSSGLVDFLEASRVRGYAEGTIEARERLLGEFLDWCFERGLERPGEITRPILQRYQRWLFHYRQASGKPLSWSTQSLRLTCLRAFFRWLVRENRILYDPSSELELPRRGQRLPKAVLSIEEVEAVLRQPDLSEPSGVRDRAILETLYSTGMRRSELVHLGVWDVDFEQGLVWIRQGKGAKDRRVPIGARAVAWVDRYRLDIRPDLLVRSDEPVLFLSDHGRAFHPQHLSQRVRRYVDAANLGKSGSCHLFRHTMATLMLEGGADLRFIQQMLGHAEIATTQVYTQVAIHQLQKVHRLTHPAQLERRRDLGAIEEAMDEIEAIERAMEEE